MGSSSATGQGPQLRLRYGGIEAEIRDEPGGAMDCADVERFFARRGVPVSAEVQPGGMVVKAFVDPSRYPLFRDAVAQYVAQPGRTLLRCLEIDGSAGADDDGGYRHAWAREDRYRSLSDRVARDMGFRSQTREGARWAQAAGGSADSLRALASAFEGLRENGRVSRFAERCVTVARQATTSPYGLPAMMVNLTGTCRVFAERLGMALLEASPRLIAMSEIAPGVVIIESTPPLDGVWDEARFWAAWRSLPEEAWGVVAGWAAVRVLRYVETADGTWKFYDHAYQPRHAASCLLPFPDDALDDAGCSEVWRRRRCCEIAIARYLLERRDTGLRRHVAGMLATPSALPRAGGAPAAVETVDEWLASVGAALHREWLRDEARDSAGEDFSQLEAALTGALGRLRAAVGKEELQASGEPNPAISCHP